jgi:long-subunit fatty acid transport protein
VIALGTGWTLTRKLRFGATLNRWVRGYAQDLTLSVEGGRERQIMTDWRMSGWNTNLGLIFTPIERLNLGVVAKTPFTADVKLRKSRTDYLPGSSGDLEPISSNAYESDEVGLNFPGAFGVGASFRAQSRLTVSADYTRTFWSHAYVYKYFVLPVSTTATTAADSTQPPRTVDTYDKLPYPYVYLTSPARQDDSEQLRVGLEYVFIGSRLKVPVRAGYYNDRQILPDRDGHTPRYNGFSVGTGLIVGPALLDLAYLYEAGSYTDTLDLRNRQRTHRFLVSLIYRHGGLP